MKCEPSIYRTATPCKAGISKKCYGVCDESYMPKKDYLLFSYELTLIVKSETTTDGSRVTWEDFHHDNNFVKENHFDTVFDETILCR